MTTTRRKFMGQVAASAALFSLHNPEPAYPESPGFKGGETSRAAAVSIDPGVDSLRWAVLVALKDHGPRTADELAGHLKVDRLSIRPRLSELRQLGRVMDSDKRRYNASGKRAIVWKLAPREDV